MIFVLQGAKSKYNRWLNAEVEERKEKGEKKRVVSLQPAWTTSAKAVHVWTECTEWILSKSCLPMPFDCSFYYLGII